MIRLLLVILPFGCLILLALWLCRCRHRRELLHRTGDGPLGLICLGCGRVRPHPWRNA